MRLTIKKHNQQIIRDIAQKLGTDDNEALNYLLLSLKAQNLNIIPTQQPQTIENLPIGFDVAVPAFAERIEPMMETDPLIQRFIDLGICDQF